MSYSSDTLRKIKQKIRLGHLIAFPTESTYGIGCDPSNYKAIRRLLLLKKRPLSKGLIVVSHKINHIKQIADISDDMMAKMSDYDNGHHQQYQNKRAISFISKSNPNTLPVLTGKRSTIAFRAICSHNLVMQLCKLMPKNSPVIATSANISGHIAQHHYNNVHRIFKDKKNLLVLPGYGKFYKKNSRIINLLNDLVVRD